MESLVTGDRAELELVVASTLDDGAVTYLQLPTEREREREIGRCERGSCSQSQHPLQEEGTLSQTLPARFHQPAWNVSLSTEREREREKEGKHFLSLCVSYTHLFFVNDCHNFFLHIFTEHCTRHLTGFL